MQDMHVMVEYYLAIKSKEIWYDSTTGMELENTIVSKAGKEANAMWAHFYVGELTDAESKGDARLGGRAGRSGVGQGHWLQWTF